MENEREHFAYQHHQKLLCNNKMVPNHENSQEIKSNTENTRYIVYVVRKCAYMHNGDGDNSTISNKDYNTKASQHGPSSPHTLSYGNHSP